MLLGGSGPALHLALIGFHHGAGSCCLLQESDLPVLLTVLPLSWVFHLEGHSPQIPAGAPATPALYNIAEILDPADRRVQRQLLGEGRLPSAPEPLLCSCLECGCPCLLPPPSSPHSTPPGSHKGLLWVPWAPIPVASPRCVPSLASPPPTLLFDLLEPKSCWVSGSLSATSAGSEPLGASSTRRGSSSVSPREGWLR